MVKAGPAVEFVYDEDGVLRFARFWDDNIKMWCMLCSDQLLPWLNPLKARSNGKI